MSDQRDEIERIQRIRERQLRLRDPRARERAFQRRVAARHTAPRLTLGGMLRDLSGKWLGTIVGGLVGIVVAIAFHVLFRSEATWVSYASYAIVLCGIVLGRYLGAVLDWRDEDHDALVRHR
ncbi:MAG: hypothetical protein JXA09_06230 [Anaerolineae bacterium]|nr:hypothetical protein [Anaerolineae bacterium]